MLKNCSFCEFFDFEGVATSATGSCVRFPPVKLNYPRVHRNTRVCGEFVDVDFDQAEAALEKTAEKKLQAEQSERKETNRIAEAIADSDTSTLSTEDITTLKSTVREPYRPEAEAVPVSKKKKPASKKQDKLTEALKDVDDASDTSKG